ncbi:MAG: hypothetical protein RIG77_04020 [Cyclobacteriaceae bacterium]
MSRRITTDIPSAGAFATVIIAADKPRITAPIHGDFRIFPGHVLSNILSLVSTVVFSFNNYRVKVGDGFMLF